jgi:DAK2 domain fusion protein YloV
MWLGLQNRRLPKLVSGGLEVSDVLISQQLAKCFVYATDWLGVYKDEVNALNVYPVPDGDTGTNMHLTMQSVRRELDIADQTRMSEVARAISYGSLLGARGNSGVILSQLLKGFTEVVRDAPEISSMVLVEALEKAAKAGYAAVMKPVEGTILTVARETAEGARTAFTRDSSMGVQELLKAALEAGHVSLVNTTNLLPVLKQAGVVDSGGAGFLHIFEGVLAHLEERELPPAPVIESYAQDQFENEEFGYCTEFLLENATKTATEIRELVQPYGDSLLVVGAEGFVKGHIHTDDPDQLLALVARHGKMVRSKIEDMSQQHTEILAMAGAASRQDAAPTAAVAVVSGYGLVKVFRSLGVRIVSGGQTQNPSVQDILDAARSVEADDVIVLPNNKNVIMAAEKAKELAASDGSGKRLHVIPTKTLGSGLGAALAFNSSNLAEDLIPNMQDAAARVTTFEVTHASRTTSIDGRDIVEGDVIGLRDDVLVTNGGSSEDAVLTMLKGAYVSQEIVTVFTGPNVSSETSEALLARINSEMPQLGVEVHTGGPDLYDYLVTLE